MRRMAAVDQPAGDCAQVLRDPASGTFKPYGTDASFGKQVCYACPMAVAARDYILTSHIPAGDGPGRLNP